VTKYSKSSSRKPWF